MRPLLRASLALCAIFTIARCAGVESRDYLCELAVAHLADCCPHFAARDIDCVSTYGCNSYIHRPVLRSDESRCMLNLDCKVVSSSGLCPAVASLPPAIVENCPQPRGWFDTTPCTYTDVTDERGPLCE